MKKFKTIGILGGMGPMASANMYKRIVGLAQKKYHAEQDYEFPPIFIYSLPLTGFDETGIVDKESVKKQLIAGAQKLEQSGADFIIIACNTVHYFAKDISKNIKIDLVSIIEQTAKEVVASKFKKVGLLTSETTKLLKIYEGQLNKKKIEVLEVDDSEQKIVNRLILVAMGGNIKKIHKDKFIRLAKNLIRRGAEGIVVGCTELPLIIQDSKLDFKVFNSSDIISDSALKKAYRN